MPYDAFISYSHAGDGRLAPRLQTGLQRFARPWWKRRMLRVFRDETGLSASPHLWSSIVDALDGSAWFILLASPEAAASDWVGREIEHWTTHHDADRILIVVTEGSFSWDESTGDIDWVNSSAAHPRLGRAFGSEPRYIDLTWARAEVNLDRRDGRFQDALAELAAPMRGVPKDELAGEDVRQHRRTIRLARGAATMLALLTAAAVVASTLAIGQRNEARDQRSEALRQRSIAEEQRTVADEQRAEAEAQRAEAEAQRAEAEAQRSRADDEALLSTARGTSAGAIAQADVSIDRSLLLGAAGVALSPSDETMNGLLASLDAAAALQGFHREIGAVTALDISSDGERIVTLKPDGRVEVWRADGDDADAAIAETALTVDNPYSVEFSGDDQHLFVISDSGLVLLDATSLEIVGAPFVPAQRIEGSALVGDISTDGSLVAAGQLDSTVIEVFDTTTGAVLTTLDLGSDCFGGVRGIDINTPTRRIAAACISMTATFDVDTGALVTRRDSFNANAPLYSPDGRILAVGYTENVLVILDAATNTVIDQVDTPGTRVYSIDFSDDGSLVAVGSDSGEVAVYVLVPNFATLAPGTNQPTEWTAADELLRFGGLEGGVLTAVFVPAHQGPFIPPLVVGGPSGVSTWDVASVPSIATQRSRSTDIGWVMLDPEAGEVYQPDSLSGAPGPTSFQVMGIDGAPRRQLTLAGDRVQLLDVAAGRLVATGAVEWPSSDPATLVAPTRFELQVVDASTGAVVTSIDLTAEHEIIPPPFAVEQFAQTPERYPDSRYEPFVRAQFSPDGTRLLVELGVSTSVWDVATGDELVSGSLLLGPIAGWGAGNATIVSGSLFGELTTYRADTLEQIGSIELGDGFSISDIEVAPGDDRLMVTSESGNIYLVDQDTLEVVGQPFTASGIQLQQTAVDRDGTLVTALDRTGALRLWRFDSRAPIGPPITVVGSDTLSSTDVHFIDAGSEPGVIVSESGSSVAFIPLSIEGLAARACELAGRQLTSDEWAEFVGDRPQVRCAGPAA